jgi:uncharacterized protein (DUF3084 family)
MTESTKNSKRFSGTQSDLIRTANEKIIVDQQLEEVTRDRDELKQQVETLSAVSQQLQTELALFCHSKQKKIRIHSHILSKRRDLGKNSLTLLIEPSL